jgi:hypothetical protein
MDLRDVSVLVPWRSEDPQRIKVWEFCKREWEILGVELCEGVDTDYGPFSTAKACNDAFKKSTRPYLMTTGADIIPDFTMVESGLHILKTQQRSWVPLARETSYFDQPTTERILAHGRWWDEVCDPTAYVPFQTGVMLIERELYEESGGHDERFTGWGGEDAAFRRVIHLLDGDSTPIELSLRCLWHDPGRRSTMSARNFALCDEYHALQTREEMLDYIEKRGRYI